MHFTSSSLSNPLEAARQFRIGGCVGQLDPLSDCDAIQRSQIHDTHRTIDAGVRRGVRNKDDSGPVVSLKDAHECCPESICGPQQSDHRIVDRLVVERGVQAEGRQEGQVPEGGNVPRRGTRYVKQI